MPIEQIGTLFVRVGALGDGYWGGWVGQGPPNQKIGLTSITYFLAPPDIRYFWQGNHQIYGHIRCIFTVLANPTYTTHT